MIVACIDHGVVACRGEAPASARPGGAPAGPVRPGRGFAALTETARRWALLAVVGVAASGCAVYKPTELHKGRAIFDDPSKVAVLVQLPEQPNVFEFDPERGGGGGMGLLQMGIVAAVTSKLTAHAKSLPMDDFRAVERELMQAVKKKGMVAEVIAPDRVKDFKPEKFETPDGTFLNKDMRPLRARLGVDRLLAVNITGIGFNYPFSGIIPIPTGDAMAWIAGEAYLIDLRTNAFQWYRKVRVLRGVGKEWDEPPKYPRLTAKYFEVLEIAKDELVVDLMK